MAEQTEHYDMLLLDMKDTFSRLTAKLLASLVHIPDLVDFKFLLKTDDDSYVRLPRILNELKVGNES